MKEKFLTTKSLSTETEIPEGTLKTWLAGSAPRSLEDVRRVAQFLNVSFEFLIFGNEESIERLNIGKNSCDLILHLRVESVDKDDSNFRKSHIIPIKGGIS
jgi:transcriptional regulator with XRE-family HTH domain